MMRRIGAAVIAALLAGQAMAAPQCNVPQNLAVPHVESASDRDPARLVPIGGYRLSLIWMPERCNKAGDRGDWLSCRDSRGFALHGLWPEGKGRDWPQWCAPAAILPQATLRAHYCATPSAQLLQHEWAKHGTCMGGSTTPERYFALSNRLFDTTRAPDMASLSRRPGLTAAQVGQAFARANPGLRPQMVRLQLNRRGWLEEVWLCLDTAFTPRRCPVGQSGARGDQVVKIWRGGR
jgi:ribonuclease T2